MEAEGTGSPGKRHDLDYAGLCVVKQERGTGIWKDVEAGVWVEVFGLQPIGVL